MYGAPGPPRGYEMRTHPRSGGFSFLEMVVVMAILIALAGIAVPIFTGEMGEARQSAALTECQRIGDAIRLYMKDTGKNPTGTNGAKTYRLLLTKGDDPSGMGLWGGGRKTQLSRFLLTGDFGGADWAGPYINEVNADPWGRAYLVNSHGFFSSERVWILSTGPDGTLNTAATATEPSGDDVGFVFE